MKIGIDISLTIGEKAGVGTYSYNLVRSLSKIDLKNRYVLFPFYYYIFHPDFKNANSLSKRNFRVKWKRVPGSLIRSLWSRKGIPREWFFGHVDILHTTTFCIPRKGYRKIVTTIYDLSFLTHPQFHVRENIEHCHKGAKDAVSFSDRIIAISNNTKADLVEILSCDPDKIDVIYLGADRNFKRIFDKGLVKERAEKYGITGDYIFYLGSIEPRKNLKGLIHAYSMLPAGIKAKYSLVLGGCSGWKNSEIYSSVAELGLLKNVKFIGFVDEGDLPALYSGASLFAYPSFYEGFGLPVLEAMGCGCPVVSSRVSSIPEVAGKAALLVNPHDRAELMRAIEKALIDKKLRMRMVAEGLRQAKRFSWDKCARETLAVYERLYRSR